MSLNLNNLLADLSVLQKTGDIQISRSGNIYTIMAKNNKYNFTCGSLTENMAFDFKLNNKSILINNIESFVSVLTGDSKPELKPVKENLPLNTETEQKNETEYKIKKINPEFKVILDEFNEYEKEKEIKKMQPIQQNFDLSSAAQNFAQAILSKQTESESLTKRLEEIENKIENFAMPKPMEIKINDLPEINLGENASAILEDLIRAAMTRQNAYIFGPAGCGKCHKINTPILMFDGSIKKVQDVVVGDQLMGPDSKPRNVLSLARGREEMFDVVPVKGETWGCNRSHILSLVNSTTSKIVNISINDYLSKSTDFKNNHKQYRSGVDFKYKKTVLDPYLVGLWLGDGSTDSPVISNPDKEIHEYLFSISGLLGTSTKMVNLTNEEKCTQISITNGNIGGGKNLVSEELKKCGLGIEKNIHNDYLINSRENRLKLLAGLIDSDGYNNGGCCEITSVSKKLADQYVFLARSLGFASYVSEKIATIKSTGFSGLYYRVMISGELSEIPTKVERKKFGKRLQKKNVLRTGFDLISTGVDDYYGFQLDGDHLYLLGDFTVTHNTTAAKQVAKALDLPFGYICLTAGASETWLFGRNTPNGFIEGQFSLIYKNGGVFLADEMDAADSNLLIALNTAIDSDELLNPMSGERIKKHKDFIFIGAGNTNGLGATGQYNGRSRLDASTLSRFVFFELNYDHSLEKALCLDKNIFTALQNTRSYLVNRKSENFITTRDFIKLSKMFVAGSSYEFCYNSLVSNFSETEKSKIKKFWSFESPVPKKNKKEKVKENEIPF